MAQEISTRNEVLQLTFANSVEAGLRLIVPIMLVRLISPSEFGQYRLFWLIGNTMMMLLPLGMVRSLLYFLPRSSPSEQSAFIQQTIFYLVVVSLPFAALLAFGGDFLPERIQVLTDRGFVVAAFALLWVVSSVILTLPNADGNVRWQAGAIVGLALFRTIIVLATAWMTRDLQSIFLALLASVFVQALVLLYYTASRHGVRWQLPTRTHLGRQFEYAVPFGLSNLLAKARGQIEQWLVVGLFLPEMLAMLAIASSFNSILHLLRKSVGNILIPRMSSRHAQGDVARALELNNRGNLVICFMIYPVVVYVWLFAAPLVELLFTRQYLEAVPVVRVYSLAMVLMSIEMATVLMIYEQGRFVAKVSASVLLISAVLSYIGATLIGLPGVPLGGLIGVLITRTLNFRRAAKLLEVPFSKVQDWSTIGRVLAGAVAAGAATSVLSAQTLAELGPFLFLVAVGVIYAVFILGFAWLFRTLWIANCMLGRAEWPKEAT